jgi:hypothetical protein
MNASFVFKGKKNQHIYLIKKAVIVWYLHSPSPYKPFVLTKDVCLELPYNDVEHMLFFFLLQYMRVVKNVQEL